MDAASDKWEKHRDILNQAFELKADGNEAYKTKNFQTAIRKYHRSLMMLRAVGLTAANDFSTSDPSNGPPREMMQQRDKLQSECYNNLAACLLTRNNPDYQRIVEHCQKVLNYDPGNVKGAYRMATALLHLGQTEKAKATATSQQAFQADKQMQTLLRSIVEREKTEDERMKATYQKMFSSPTKPPASTADPVIIKSVRAGDAESETNTPSMTPDMNPTLTGTPTPGQTAGTKFIQVASAEKEAAC